MTKAVVALHVRSDTFSDLRQRQDVVGNGGRVAGAAQVQPMQCGVVHGQRQTPAFADRRGSQRAVAIEAPHDQADHIAVLVMRHRDEEAVDQPVVALAAGQGAQADAPFFQRHDRIGRRQIEAPRLQPLTIIGHRQQGGLTAKQFAQARLIQ